MRVVYFGTYERRHPRNALVIAALRGAGVDVLEQNVEVWDEREHKHGAGLSVVGPFVRAQWKLRKRRPAGDAVIVGYPGHLDLGAAHRANPGRPVVLNPLVSLYDTLVTDRERFSARSVVGRTLRAVDRKALRGADLIVSDTDAHADFFADLGGIDRDRIVSCFVGADEAIFHPPWSPEEPFTCLFVGKLSPLHGIESILGAAERLPDVRFRIVGSGQLDRAVRNRPANVEHLPWLPYDRLGDAYRAAGCALGIFGASAKVGRVIPIKAFHALACGVPLVTARTPAASELLVENESALLVRPNDPDELASAIERLRQEPALARSIADGGLKAYRERASEGVLGKRWRRLIEPLV
jgi:glycosyltransferase involved in cell wall biosynthesis